MVPPPTSPDMAPEVMAEDESSAILAADEELEDEVAARPVALDEHLTTERDPATQQAGVTFSRGVLYSIGALIVTVAAAAFVLGFFMGRFWAGASGTAVNSPRQLSRTNYLSNNDWLAGRRL